METQRQALEHKIRAAQHQVEEKEEEERSLQRDALRRRRA
jgi:hypothetical protein